MIVQLSQNTIDTFIRDTLITYNIEWNFEYNGLNLLWGFNINDYFFENKKYLHIKVVNQLVDDVFFIRKRKSETSFVLETFLKPFISILKWRFKDISSFKDVFDYYENFKTYNDRVIYHDLTKWSQRNVKVTFNNNKRKIKNVCTMTKK